MDMPTGRFFPQSRVPRRGRVPVAMGPDGQLGYGWVRGWETIRFQATQVKRGSNDYPSFDYDNLGLLFPEGDATEVVYMLGELPHRYILGTDIRPQVFYIQNEASVPTFKLDYRWYNLGDTVSSWTTIVTEGQRFTYESGSVLQSLIFPAIDGSHIADLSSLIDMKLYRDDADVSGDVLYKEFNIHFQADGVGSFTEFEK